MLGAAAVARLDTETGKEVASGEIAGSTDDLFYDPSRARAYVLTSQGFLEVFQQKDANHYAGLRVTRLHPAHKLVYSSLNRGNFSRLYKSKASRALKSA